MLGNENPVKIVVVSNDLILPDCLENMLDPQKFVLETADPNSQSIVGTQKTLPDIFVVDSANAGGDVLGICQNIRFNSETPILVLGTNHKPEMVEQVLDAGADEFLIKPVSGNIMAAYLKNLTRRARAERDAALSMENGENDKNQQARLLAY